MQNLLPETNYDTDVFIVALGDTVQAKAFEILANLRRANAKFTIILGEDELQANSVVLKNMNESTQETISIDELLNKLTTLTK